MKHCVRILVLLLLTVQLHAQSNTFTLDFNFGTNDEAFSVIQNTAGNFVVCGTVYPGGNNFNPIVAEVSPAGVILQSYTLTSATSEIFRSIVQTSDGGYFITGNVFSSASDFNALILKLDGSFQPEFYRQIVNNGINDNANRGFEIAPGVYGVTGSIGLSGAVKPTYLVLDNTGNIISQTYLGTNQFASPDYRGRHIGNGQVTMGHLTNAFSVLDSSVKQLSLAFHLQSDRFQQASTRNHGAEVTAQCADNFDLAGFKCIPDRELNIEDAKDTAHESDWYSHLGLNFRFEIQVIWLRCYIIHNHGFSLGSSCANNPLAERNR